MWIHDGNKGVGGLFYADPEESYFTPDHIFYHHFRHIDIKLLKSQLNYFVYTIEWLHYLNHEIAWKQGRLAGHNWPRPPILLRPPLHNLPQKHIPPFLTEDQKALFLKHIEAEKTGAQKPTPKQQAQEKERSLKRAKQEEQRKKSREGKPRKNGKPKDES
jgi:hypothetical protein